MSEILLVSGTLSIYGIFILITSYWIYMLIKLSNESEGSTSYNHFFCFRIENIGAIGLFMIFMGTLMIGQILGIFLYLFKFINSEGLILFDSILMSTISLVVSITITFLSKHIQLLLSNYESIANINPDLQNKRIYAIVVAINIYLVLRVTIELTLTLSFIKLMIGK